MIVVQINEVFLQLYRPRLNVEICLLLIAYPSRMSAQQRRDSDILNLQITIMELFTKCAGFIIRPWQ